MSLSGWVSNANEGHDKDMGHKLVYVEAGKGVGWERLCKIGQDWSAVSILDEFDEITWD